MKKNYFYLTQKWDDYFWTNDNWDVLRFWWHPKFIIDSLVDLYWKEWIKIFNQFLNACDNISKVWKFRNRTGTFVLYKNENIDDNYKKWRHKFEKKVYSNK